MAYDPTDAVTARALFEDAIGVGSKPDLSETQIDRYFALAEDDGEYPATSLNLAAAQAWRIKAGLTAHRYELSAGSGRTLKQQQWHAHCRQMANDYLYGVASVTGENVASDLNPEYSAADQVVTVIGGYQTGWSWED